ncbi:MAG: hypothetical protein ACYC7D_12490 [Nitrososphaerales archaeon]
MQEYAKENQLAIYKHNLAIVEQQLRESKDQESRKKMLRLKEDLSKKIQAIQEQMQQ